MTFNWAQYALACFAEEPDPLRRSTVAIDGRYTTCYSPEVRGTHPVDVVVVGSGAGVRAADARRLTARARERGAVLMVLEGGATSPVWPDAVDLRWRVTAARWDGLGEGHGHLATRQVEVEVVGRGAATRPRRAWTTIGPTVAGPTAFVAAADVGPTAVVAAADVAELAARASAMSPIDDSGQREQAG